MALVLKIKIGEVLHIDDDVEVKVLGVEGTQVKLGIIAPPAVAVDRAKIRASKLANRNKPAPAGDQQPLSNANVPARDILRLRK